MRLVLLATSALLSTQLAFAQTGGTAQDAVTPTAETASASTPAQEETTRDMGRVMATVNGQDITYADLVLMFESIGGNNYPVPFEQLEPLLLQQAIDTHLLLQAGKEAGLDQDEDVQRQINFVTNSIIQQNYAMRLVEEQVNDATIQEAYDTFVNEQQSEKEVRARHILLKTEEEAKAVIEELNAGADFVELAKEKSTGPSGANGGDLGFFDARQMVKPFSDAAFQMDVGQHSETPVQTQFGWHVIKVEDQRDKPQPSLEQMQNQIREQLEQEVIENHIQELRANADIEVKTETPAAGAEDTTAAPH